jgi:hypothetical protein
VGRILEINFRRIKGCCRGAEGSAIFDFGYGEKRERRRLGVWVEREKEIDGN